MGIRVFKDNKLGFSYTTEPSEIDSIVKRAISLSKMGKEIKGFHFPEQRKSPTIEKTYDRRMEDLRPESGLEDMKQLIQASKEVDRRIIMADADIKYRTERFYITNSSGLEVEEKGTFLATEAYAVLKEDGLSNGFDFSYSRVLDVDFTSVGRGAADLALRTKKPRKVESKVMSVLFDPYALRDLMEFVLMPSLYGDLAQKGESIYSDKMGEMVATNSISLADDPTYPNGWNSASVDDEGVPSKRTDLIKRGQLVSFLYDLNAAFEYGKQSTSNGIRAERSSLERNFKTPPNIGARNFVIRGKSRRVEDLVEETGQGILVHNVLGAHTSNPASGDFSVNSSRCFKIEKGEIAYPIRSVMLSGNLPSCLKKVSGLGDDFRFVRGAIGSVSILAPTVRFEGIVVTG